MKKQYINPSMDIVKIQPYMLQAVSDPKVGIGDGTVPPGSVQSRRYRGFEEDEEDDEDF